MSSCNIEVESEEKLPRRESWFNRRRRSIFSSSRRMWRHGSRKKNSDDTSTGSGEASSTSSEASKGSVVVEGNVPTRGGSCRKGEGDAPESIPGMLECPLCLNTQSAENFPALSTCHHRSCLTCLRQYLTIEITESRVNLMCPECQEKLHPTDMRSILDHDPTLFSKWEEFTLRRALSIDPDCRWCPAPDCGFAVIAHGCASCPRLMCQRPGCQTEFCYHCRQEWHPNQTCDAAHLQRTRQLRIRSNSAAYSHRSSYHADEIKPCPKCGVLIVKLDDGSCNHITCSVCEADFCWLCLQEITDLHYLSPSGCTFWGKKRWSKKKKILWQLGLLIGAPICIGIAAGIAVPAIMVALPIWVGRRVRSLLENRDASKLKRNLVFATCVSFSIVLSPVVAALAIGIGVPVVLIYVYGVVPFSFCRSGYGDQTSGASSMLPANFLFDLGGTSGQPVSTTSNEGTTYNGPPNNMAANPSIGEASVGGITMGSFNTSRGSNLDKIGRTDLDLASTMAMAGTSITGSITGISAGGALNSRSDVISKDLDQHSILTQTSAGSIPGVASVQVHMSETTPDQVSSSHLPASTRTSIKYSGGMRKTRAGNKRSSSVKSNPPNKMESHGVQVVDDSLIISMTVDGPPPLTIVDETEIPQSLELHEAPCTSSSP